MVHRDGSVTIYYTMVKCENRPHISKNGGWFIMKTKNELKYSKKHEWVRFEGTKAYVGITDYAQNSLGEIVFVDLPAIGDSIKEGGVLGAIESIKTASDVYSPIAGKVVERNEELIDNPGKINNEPYESWIAVLETSDVAQLEVLMDEDDYVKFCTGGV